MAGYETVTAHLEDGTLAGYVHVVTLEPGRAWWTSLGEGRPAEVVQAAEKGHVFWLRELMVLPGQQNGRRPSPSPAATAAPPR